MRISVRVCLSIISEDPAEFGGMQLEARVQAAAAENATDDLSEDQVRAIFGEYADEVLRIAGKVGNDKPKEGEETG